MIYFEKTIWQPETFSRELALFDMGFKPNLYLHYITSDSMRKGLSADGRDCSTPTDLT